MKQEQKNKWLAATLVLLLGVTALLYVASRTESAGKIDDSPFRVEDFSIVNKVQMTSPRGVVVLQYNGSRWRVNDTYDADRQLVKVLFATAEQVVPRRPVAEKFRDSLRAVLSTTGTKVEYFTGDNLTATYTVGGNAQLTEAYFQTDSDGPYVMGIPGYRVYASGVFEQSENDWRDKRIFNLNWRNFASLSTTFVRSAADGFEVTLKDGVLELVGIPESDTTRLNDYMDNISFLSATRYYEKGTSARVDSLLAGPLSFSTAVTDIRGRSIVLDVFPPLKGDNNVYGQTGGEYVVFGKSDIIQIAKRRGFFKPAE